MIAISFGSRAVPKTIARHWETPPTSIDANLSCKTSKADCGVLDVLEHQWLMKASHCSNNHQPPSNSLPMVVVHKHYIAMTWQTDWSHEARLSNKLFQQRCMFFSCDRTSVDSGVWNGVEWKMWSVKIVKCWVGNVVCRVWSLECKVQSVECKV